MNTQAISGGLPSNSVPLGLDSARAWRTYTGGAKLDALHGKENCTISQFPEEWIMSVVEARNAGREDIVEGLSHLVDGDKQSLKELVDANPSYYLGQAHAAKWGGQMGVLVKLIDAAERLTVQVHPDKAAAMELFQSAFGKTECWHILDTFEVDGQPACIYMGFKPGIDRATWQHLFDVQDIQGMLDCMNRIEVKKGETILINGGVAHAIGAGCFLAEIQEPTDLTIRIERITPAGLPIAESMCHQGLGFEKMFDCFHYYGVTEAQGREKWFIPPTVLHQGEGTLHQTLIGYDTCPLFALEELQLSKPLTIECPAVFCGLYVLEGAGTLVGGGVSRAIGKAQQYFIPAGTGELTFIPQEGAPLRVLRFFGPQEG